MPTIPRLPKRYHPDGKLTSGEKHDVCYERVVHLMNSEEWIAEENEIVTKVDQVNTMNTGEDEPSSGLNGRLRPRKSNSISSPSPVGRSSRKSDSRPVLEKKKNSNPKPSPNKPDDLNKSDTSSEPKFLCPYCDKTFISRLSATKHVRRTHISNKRDDLTTCLLCNHTDAEPNDIIRHMVDSHPNQYFACLDCHTRFPSTSELAEHKLNVCEKQKPAYRSKLRQKSSSLNRKNKKRLNTDDKNDFSNENKEFTDDHGFNGIVISCELKPSQAHDATDIEDKITTNLILPPSKALGNAGLEKNAVIVLDDIQWNKRIPPNFSFHNTDADQILSRLGVVHRSPRVGESTRRAWFKMIDENSQKFEKCFDTNFYTRVASNVHENLTRFLDGSFNFNPDPKLNIIKTRKSKNNVVINTAEGFPILLACDQYSRNLFEGYVPRSLAPKHKWKWGTIDNGENAIIDPNDIKRDNHVNNCIITLVSSLDIWTQLCMRRKFEDVYNIKSSEKTDKHNIISNELKEILESREIPTTSSQIVKYNSKPAVTLSERSDFPSYLGLSPSPPACDLQPAVLSGEWVRPRCYVCCACGAQTRDSRGLSSHMSTQHPNAQVQHYEIVGEPLLNADIFKHLYVPPNQISNRTRPTRGFRDCTKCQKSVTLEDLHQHMLDCAGDTPAIRRKCRYRPFGVRRRRPRLPDNTIRKKMRKEIRSRHRQKGHIRQRPKIRSEVGDAETIRKMIADLPAKRHRVVVSSSANILRPRRKIEKQRNKLKIRQPSYEDPKNRRTRSGKEMNSKPLDTKKKQVDSANTDDDDKPLKPKTKTKSEKSTQSQDQVPHKMALSKLKKKVVLESLELRSNELREQSGICFVQNQKQDLSMSNASFRLSLNSSEYNTKEYGDNAEANNNRNHDQHPRRAEDGGGVGSNNQNNNEVPEPKPPLKLSIARLTGNQEIGSTSYHNQNVSIEQETNRKTHETNHLRQEFVNDTAEAKVDKPPLVIQNKPKFRKRLNDCIARLTKKLPGTQDYLEQEEEIAEFICPKKDNYHTSCEPQNPVLEKNALDDQKQLKDLEDIHKRELDDLEKEEDKIYVQSSTETPGLNENDIQGGETEEIDIEELKKQQRELDELIEVKKKEAEFRKRMEQQKQKQKEEQELKEQQDKKLEFEKQEKFKKQHEEAMKKQQEEKKKEEDMKQQEKMKQQAENKKQDELKKQLEEKKMKVDKKKEQVEKKKEAGMKQQEERQREKQMKKQEEKEKQQNMYKQKELKELDERKKQKLKAEQAQQNQQDNEDDEELQLLQQGDRRYRKSLCIKKAPEPPVDPDPPVIVSRMTNEDINMTPAQIYSRESVPSYDECYQYEQTYNKKNRSYSETRVQRNSSDEMYLVSQHYNKSYNQRRNSYADMEFIQPNPKQIEPMRRRSDRLKASKQAETQISKPQVPSQILSWVQPTNEFYDDNMLNMRRKSYDGLLPPTEFQIPSSVNTTIIPVLHKVHTPVSVDASLSSQIAYASVASTSAHAQIDLYNNPKLSRQMFSRKSKRDSKKRDTETNSVDKQDQFIDRHQTNRKSSSEHLTLIAPTFPDFQRDLQGDSNVQQANNNFIIGNSPLTHPQDINVSPASSSEGALDSSDPIKHRSFQFKSSQRLSRKSVDDYNASEYRRASLEMDHSTNITSHDNMDPYRHCIEKSVRSSPQEITEYHQNYSDYIRKQSHQEKCFQLPVESISHEHRRIAIVPEIVVTEHSNTYENIRKSYQELIHQSELSLPTQADIQYQLMLRTNAEDIRQAHEMERSSMINIHAQANNEYQEGRPAKSLLMPNQTPDNFPISEAPVDHGVKSPVKGNQEEYIEMPIMNKDSQKEMQDISRREFVENSNSRHCISLQRYGSPNKNMTDLIRMPVETYMYSQSNQRRGEFIEHVSQEKSVQKYSTIEPYDIPRESYVNKEYRQVRIRPAHTRTVEEPPKNPEPEPEPLDLSGKYTQQVAHSNHKKISHIEKERFSTNEYGTLDLSTKNINENAVVDLRVNPVSGLANKPYKKPKAPTDMPYRRTPESPIGKEFNQVQEFLREQETNRSQLDAVQRKSLASYSKEIQETMKVSLNMLQHVETPTVSTINVTSQNVFNINNADLNRSMMQDLKENLLQENAIMARNSPYEIPPVVYKCHELSSPNIEQNEPYNNQNLAILNDQNYCLTGPLQSSIVNTTIDRSENVPESIYASKVDHIPNTSLPNETAAVAVLSNTIANSVTQGTLSNVKTNDEPMPNTSYQVQKEHNQIENNTNILSNIEIIEPKSETIEIERNEPAEEDEPKTVETIGSLPKALVDIIAGIPKPHRGPLLEVLPLYVGKQQSDNAEENLGNVPSDEIKNLKDNTTIINSEIQTTNKAVTVCDTTTSITDNRLTVNTSLYPQSCVLPKKRHSPKPLSTKSVGVQNSEEAHSTVKPPVHVEKPTTLPANKDIEQKYAINLSENINDSIRADNLIVDPYTGLLSARSGSEIEHQIPEIKVIDLTEDEPEIAAAPPTPTMLPVTEIHNPVKPKSTNDQTSVLRSIRIKAQSERKLDQQSITVQCEKDKTCITQTIQNETTECYSNNSHHNIEPPVSQPCLSSELNTVKEERYTNQPKEQEQPAKIVENVYVVVPEIKNIAHDAQDSLALRNTVIDKAHIATSTIIDEKAKNQTQTTQEKVNKLDNLERDPNLKINNINQSPKSLDAFSTSCQEVEAKSINVPIPKNKDSETAIDLNTNFTNDLPKPASSKDVLASNVQLDQNDDSDDDVSLAVIVRKKQINQLTLPRPDSVKEKTTIKKKLRNKKNKMKSSENSKILGETSKHRKASQEAICNIRNMIDDDDAVSKVKSTRKTIKQTTEPKQDNIKELQLVINKKNNVSDEKIIAYDKEVTETFSQNQEMCESKDVDTNTLQSNCDKKTEIEINRQSVGTMKVDESKNVFEIPQISPKNVTVDKTNNQSIESKLELITEHETLKSDDVANKKIKKTRGKLKHVDIPESPENTLEGSDLATPLRRSRRKKSLYIENLNENEMEYDCDRSFIDEKSPLTKKQIIVSKYSHEEEKPSEESTSSLITDIVSTEAQVSTNKELEEDKTTSRTVKRKKSPHTKRKKKRFSIEEDEEPLNKLQEAPEQLIEATNLSDEKIISCNENVINTSKEDISSAEKRKIPVIPSTNDSFKPKKTKLDQRFEHDITDKAVQIIDKDSDTPQHVLTPVALAEPEDEIVEEITSNESIKRADTESRATCYNRSTQNSIMKFNQPSCSSKSDMNYDPYDIDLEDMIEVSEPLAKSNQKKTKNAANAPKVSQAAKSNAKSNIQFSFKFNAEICVSSEGNENALEEPRPMLQAIDNASVSDSDSSKSDVPLQKYVEEKERKLLTAAENIDPSNENEMKETCVSEKDKNENVSIVEDGTDVLKNKIISDTDNAATDISGESSQIPTNLSLENTTASPVRNVDNSADIYVEQNKEPRRPENVIEGEKLNKEKKTRRSIVQDEPEGNFNVVEAQHNDKFMENFGFFSERKPRKSNLLASKKISETFHMIEDDDIYFGAKERTSRKSAVSDTKKANDGIATVKATNQKSVCDPSAANGSNNISAPENKVLNDSEAMSQNVQTIPEPKESIDREAILQRNDATDVKSSQLHTKFDTHIEEVTEDTCTLEDHSQQSAECTETNKKSLKNKLKRPPGYKEKMYPDIEEIDLFEDKFDKIKRKCRSQAAAAKQSPYVVESSSSKSRKKPDKKVKKKESKKSATVLTKGAMKVFDGIKISIPTQDLNMPPNVSPPRLKKRKNNAKKKRERMDSDSSRGDSELNLKDNLLERDVYEFKDNDDTELLELRPSTVMDRFRSMNKEKVKCKDKDKGKDSRELVKESAKLEGNNDEIKEFKRKSKTKHITEDKVSEAVKNVFDKNDQSIQHEKRVNEVVIKRKEKHDETTYIPPKQPDGIDKRLDDDIFKKPSNDIRFLGKRVETREKDSDNDAGDDDEEEFDDEKSTVSPIPGPSGFVPDSNEDSSFDWSGSSDADYVYMSDSYGCNCMSDSEDSETEKGCEITTCLYRKRNAEKNAVMGRIFKNNAVRKEKVNAKPKEAPKPNLDQLFDSLLESNSNDSSKKAAKNKDLLHESSEEIFTTPPMSPEHNVPESRSLESISTEKTITKSPQLTQTSSTTYLNNDDTSSDYVFASDSESNQLNKSDGIDQYVMMSSKSIQSEDPEIVMKTAVHTTSLVLEQDKNDDDSDPEADDFIVLKRNALTSVTSTQTEATHIIASDDDDDLYADCSMNEDIIGNTPQPGDLTMMSVKSTQTEPKRHKSKSRHDEIYNRKSLTFTNTEKIGNDFLVLKKFVATVTKCTQTDHSKVKSRKSSKHEDGFIKHHDSNEGEGKRSKEKASKKTHRSESKNHDRNSSMSEEDVLLHKNDEPITALDDDSIGERYSPFRTSDDGTGQEYGADIFDRPALDEAGVARQRARRKCTVGKQNVLAEHWSSESETDLVSPRPNSADSVTASIGRRKKTKRKEGQQASSKRLSRHGSGKKHEIEGRVSSINKLGRVGSEDGAGPSRAVPQGPKIRARPTHAHYWSSDGEEDTGNQPQHGWIVGDSHKKLVTMLANAKGRKRNNDDKRNLDE